MNQSIEIHGVKRIITKQAQDRTTEAYQKYQSKEITIICDDGSEVVLTCFSDKEPIIKYQQ